MTPAGRLVWYGVLLLFALFFLIPIAWLLLAPTRSNQDLVNGGVFGFGSFANIGRAWDHLMLFNDRELLRWIWNSVLYAAAALLITLGTAIPAGYAMATLRFGGRRLLLWTTLVVMITPASALVLPLFLTMNAVGLVGNALSVILPMAFFPFGAYLAYIYFATSLPGDLLDAGRIDGCSELQLFRYVALPLARPVAALVIFFSFVANWQNYFLPFVMLTDDTTYNLPVGLGALMSGTPALNPANGGTQLPIERPEVALAGIVTILPILALFVFSQRYVVAGTLSGATKA